MSLAKKTSDLFGTLIELAMLAFAVLIVGGLIWAVLAELVF